MPPSTRGPYLQGSWLAPKPISLISFKHQNLFWCSISDKHLEVALNLLAYRLKGCRLPRSYCSPTKLHVSLQAINKSILGVRESDNINKLMAANQKFRVTQYIYIYVYIPLKTINQFELNTCWIANVYVLNILSYNEIMKYFSISCHTCTKYTNIHTSCPHFQASTPVQISLSSTFTSAKLDDQIIGTKKTCWSDQQNLMDFSCQIQAKTKHKNLIVPVC